MHENAFKVLFRITHKHHLNSVKTLTHDAMKCAQKTWVFRKILKKKNQSGISAQPPAVGINSSLLSASQSKLDFHLLLSPRFRNNIRYISSSCQRWRIFPDISTKHLWDFTGNRKQYCCLLICQEEVKALPTGKETSNETQGGSLRKMFPFLNEGFLPAYADTANYSGSTECVRFL